MEMLVCPSCGAALFASAKVAPKAIFRVFEDYSTKLVEASSSAIDDECIYCASCSWTGAISKLVIEE